MIAKIRIGLFTLYSAVNSLIVYALFASFQRVKESEHPIMNFFAYLIGPIFFAICAVLAFIVLFIINRIESNKGTFQFKMLTLILLVFLVVDIAVYVFYLYW